MKKKLKALQIIKAIVGQNREKLRDMRKNVAKAISKKPAIIKYSHAIKLLAHNKRPGYITNAPGP
jgi:hypothetical protein